MLLLEFCVEAVDALLEPPPPPPPLVWMISGFCALSAAISLSSPLFEDRPMTTPRPTASGITASTIAVPSPSERPPRRVVARGRAVGALRVRLAAFAFARYWAAGSET